MDTPIGIRKDNILLTFSTNGTTSFDKFRVNLCKKDHEIVAEYEDDATSFWGYRPDGNKLEEYTEYQWQVILLKNGQVICEEKSCFETGGTLSGMWINNENFDGSIQHFRKRFRCDEIRTVYLVISGLGYYDFTINDQKIDETYFKPVVTNYDDRNHTNNREILTGGKRTITYETYDITNLIKCGENVLDVRVSGGYYHNLDQACVVNVSYAEPKLYFELHFKNGCEIEKIISDESCMVCNTKSFSTLYRGDKVHFESEEGQMYQAKRAKPPSGQAISQMLPNDRIQKRIVPTNVRRLSNQERLYDFGVNHSGTLCFKAHGKKEEHLIVKFAESLNEDGTPNYETATWHGCDDNGVELDTISQENHYYLSGEIDVIEPLFSWKCYRYVVIESQENTEIFDVESLFIYMPLEKNSYFKSSEPIFNRLEEVFNQTLFSNMHSGLITDCPHREKLPYTGDGHLIMKSVLYELDSVDFYRKWLQDICDSQMHTGQIPNAAPAAICGGGYAWGNAICTVPKQLYEFTGDRNIVEVSYPYVTRWLEYYESKHEGDYVIRKNGQKWMLGDWLAPEAVQSNVYYISTVCYLMAAKCALEFSEILDNSDRSKWKKLTENIKKAINHEFFDEHKVTYGNGVQGEDVLALATNIVPDEYRSALEEKVFQHYTKSMDYHLDTGIVLTPILIQWLTDNGYQEVAYRIMTQKTYPSFYNLIENETTLSEHWSKKWPDYYIGDEESRLVKGGGDLSHCHPMYGSVVSWLYDRVAGLDLSMLLEHVVGIYPSFMEQMESAEAWKDTIFGRVSVCWKRKDGMFTMEINVPENLDVECKFPLKEEKLTVTSQTEKFTVMKQEEHFNFKLPAGSWLVTNEVERE